MTLTINSLGDNPQTPGIYAETYIPDQLIAGNLKLVTQSITLNSGTLQRGAVLGQQSGAPTSTAALTTGNGTIGSLSGGNSVQSGAYVLRATSATNWNVTAPDGYALPSATTGAAYVGPDINFTITAGGTAFAAGDEFVVNVPSGNYVSCVKTASDGSQIPVGILADYADASGGAVVAGIYVMGEFNVNAILPDASWGANAAAWGPALSSMLRNTGIFLKSVVSALDPS